MVKAYLLFTDKLADGRERFWPPYPRHPVNRTLWYIYVFIKCHCPNILHRVKTFTVIAFRRLRGVRIALHIFLKQPIGRH